MAAFSFGLAACQAISVSAQDTGSLPDVQAEGQNARPEDLARVEDALQQSKVKQQDLIAAQSAAEKAQEELSDRLVTLAMTMSEQEQSLALTEQRLGKLEVAVAKSQLALAARRDELSRLLAGLQRLEQDPPPALVVKPDDVLQALRGAMMFSAVVPSLREKADAVKAELASLRMLKEQLEAERMNHANGLDALSHSRSALADLIAEKRVAAEQANHELVLERANAETLAQQAVTLRDLLTRLEKARRQAEAAKALEAARLAESQKKQAAEAEAKALAAAQAALPDFDSLKGKLAMPAPGQMLKDYGSETGLGHGLPGIALKTAAHAQVVSPTGGRIEFAGQFRSYGGLVIINAGQNHLVLLAGMERVLASTGQSVKAGEPLGEMGLKSAEMTLSNDLTNPSFPVLYVEFRKNTAPIDPSPWWVANTQEAKR